MSNNQTSLVVYGSYTIISTSNQTVVTNSKELRSGKEYRHLFRKTHYVPVRALHKRNTKRKEERIEVLLTTLQMETCESVKSFLLRAKIFSRASKKVNQAELVDNYLFTIPRHSKEYPATIYGIDID
jgi:hypothetical protein